MMILKTDIQALAFLAVRVLTGIILIKVGLEAFSATQMSGYVQWLTDIGFPLPGVMAYVGKLAELAGGLSLVLGIYLRWAMIPTIIAMLVITFIMGEGSLMDSSFLILLLCILFLCTGAGRWSLENYWLRKKNLISGVIILLFCLPLNGQTTTWVQKPLNQWPQIAMINEVWYNNGEQYLDPSFKYVGTGFLIDIVYDTLAVTAKHVLWVAKTKSMTSVKIKDQLSRWIMHPKGNIADSVVIDRLINEDDSEMLNGSQSSIIQRDWLVFTIGYRSPDIRPLIPSYREVQPGEFVWYQGCPYEDSTCMTFRSKVLGVVGHKFFIEYPAGAHLGGASGSPIIDQNGRLVGILSGSGIMPGTGVGGLYGMTTRYLHKVLTGFTPLNTALVSIAPLMDSLIRSQGIATALRIHKALKASSEYYFQHDYEFNKINSLIKVYINESQFSWAIGLAKLNVEEFPIAVNYLSLAESFLAEGKKNSAIKVLTKAQQLFPENIQISNALAIARKK